MARRKTVQQWLSELHDAKGSYAGRTDREISIALGRGTKGESFIQKVRTGKKEGGTLLTPVKHLVEIQRERKSGTAKPLPTVEATRRKQALRQPQKHSDVSGRHTFYEGKRTAAGLENAIKAAMRRGDRVRLTITWANVRYGTGHRTNRVYHHVPLTLWPNGEEAYDALSQLDDAGYRDDPAGALANLTYEDPIVQEVSGVEAWQLHTISPSGEETWDDQPNPL